MNFRRGNTHQHARTRWKRLQCPWEDNQTQKPMDEETQKDIQPRNANAQDGQRPHDSLTYFGRVAVQASAQKMVLAIRFTATADRSV